MANDYSRNIAFVTTSAGYELLTDTNIKNAIKTRLGITSDSAYTSLLNNGIANMGFCVFANTRISVNSEPYEYNEPIFGSVVGDGSIGTALIKSIKIEDNNVDGTFYFRIS